jgi:hypothetical protein
VIARISSFYFKGRAEKLETIAHELRVANVLEGSVRKSGNRLRVTTQLIRADTSEHLWSETFDRDLHDVFKVQDEIASAVVTALKVHLLPRQAAGQGELRTENLEAYNLYLQGRQSYNQADAAGYQRAVTAFRAATALDPGYAAAYADLALAQFWLTSDTDTNNDSIDVPGWDGALAAAEKAVALAPGAAAGYSARGFVRAVYRFDFAGGCRRTWTKPSRLTQATRGFCTDLPSSSACLASCRRPLPERSRRSRSIPLRQRSACALHSSWLQISKWHGPVKLRLNTLWGAAMCHKESFSS